MAKKEELVVVDLANDENDDWLKKAYPQHREEELRIHEDLAKKNQAYGKPKE